MEICKDNHEEIVFDSRDCPLCVEQGIVKELEEKVEELEGNLKEVFEKE